MQQTDFDAVIVGAGFAGIYQLHKLRSQGLSVLVIDQASDVGGTWFWNQYPGAMSDTESYIYRFSWDKEDLRTYPWKDHYVKQPEVLAYLNHIVKKHDMRKNMRFNTELKSADWDDKNSVWRIETSGGALTSRYFVTCLGLLSKQNFPDIPGIDSFKGEKYHTGAWPQGVDLTGKRVGVIGCGSTGVQVITAVADKVKTLTCFQRHPQYSVPSGDGPVSPEYRAKINENYDQIMEQLRNSAVAFGFEESTIPTMSVSEEERERTFQRAWDLGNGFRFMFWTFNDITVDPAANEAACQFIRRKISEVVTDPEKARKLTPHDLYARRPLCDGGYYQQFNRSNVDIVDLKETPITELVSTGIKTSDGTVHDLDVVIFATGFDAVEGNYSRLRIHGRGGQTLKDHWDNGPTAYLGVCVPDFPNMFMVTGPMGPFTNIPPTVETHVEFIADTIERAEKQRHGGKEVVIVEATAQAERDWIDECEDVAKDSLFKKTDSWIFGKNITGKKTALRFYFGGLKKYRDALSEVVENDYRGFKPLTGGGGGGGGGGSGGRTKGIEARL